MNQKYRHMVIFCLKYEKHSKEAETFLKDGNTLLTQIPGVEDFKVFNQISLKNDFDYGFSMEFSNEEAYKVYNEHPIHVDFVNQRWLNEVTRFLEIDFYV